jgi:hypothetical protein
MGTRFAVSARDLIAARPIFKPQVPDALPIPPDQPQCFHANLNVPLHKIVRNLRSEAGVRKRILPGCDLAALALSRQNHDNVLRHSSRPMRIKPYKEQLESWPQSGRHILAQFDSETIYIYQAYRPAIARYALAQRQFGGEFSFDRMSWIKPNFLWMMFRCGWATKQDQEHVLAVQLKRSFFDELLRSSVPSTFDPKRYGTHEKWQAAVESSDVRLQWDPDHDPMGRPVARRAVQLGLRGETLRRFATREIVSIEDVTAFVAEQRLLLHGDLTDLRLPEEGVYRPSDAQAAAAVGIEESWHTAT